MIVVNWDSLMNLVRSKEEITARNIIETDARVQKFVNEYGRQSFEKRKLTDKSPATPPERIADWNFGGYDKETIRFVLKGEDKTDKYLVNGILGRVGGECHANWLNVYYNTKEQEIVQLVDVAVKYTVFPTLMHGMDATDPEITDIKTTYKKEMGCHVLPEQTRDSNITVTRNR